MSLSSWPHHLSYYTLFSLTPLLVIAIAVAGLVFGREAAQNQIVETIGGMIGPESAQAIQGIIENASNKPKTGIISTVLATVTLLIGAGGVVGQLQDSLNKIWGVEPKSGQGIWVFIRQRFISFPMVLAGHMLSAAIAYQILRQENPQSIDKVKAVPEKHPWYANQWQEASMGSQGSNGCGCMWLSCA